MLKKMKFFKSDTIKNCMCLFAVSITAGFIAGCGMAAYTVFVRHYLRHELYYLSAGIVKQTLATGIVTACVICAIVLAFVGLAQALSFFMFSPEKRPARAKLLSVVLVGLAVCAWGIYTVDYYRAFIAAGRFHVRILACHAGIIICVLLLGYAFHRYSLLQRIVRIGSNCRLPAALALVFAGILTGGFFMYETYFVPEKPNVILVSIDALRADHVGCYGYHRNTTPNIDAFANESVLFKNAFVHDGWTLPSHLSMLTGLYSMTHGVGADYTTPLPFGIRTLSELLKNDGYAALGFANGVFWMAPMLGFGRGFDFYNLSLSYNPDSPERNAEYQNKFIEKHVGSRKRKNNFIFIHYYDVHSDVDYLPYDSPPPYSGFFTDSDFDLFDGVDHGYRATDYLGYLNREKVMPDPERLEYIIGLYDNSIAYMDACIGDLFAMLKEQGLYDNSIIIITADHGESFGEHGFFGHGNHYQYNEDIHVPLIIKLPDSKGASGGVVINDFAEIIDLVPTIFDYLAVQGFPVEGVSLRRIIEKTGDAKEYIDGVTSRASLYVRSMKWKLMSDNGLNRNHYRLYDVENDPGEQHNVALEYPEIEEYLEEKLRSRIAESLKLRARLLGSDRALKGADSGRKLRLDDKEQERLRSLGYIL